ncbi:MAG: hypothetical protein WA655_16555 [Candidatus Korobacteraceae bacterium]
MAAKRLEIHPEALEEFKSALNWYLERSETAAVNFVNEFDHAVDLIVRSPKRWPRGEYATRKFALQRFPFAIVYREKETHRLGSRGRPRSPAARLLEKSTLKPTERAALP